MKVQRKMAGGYGGDSPGSVRKGSSMPDGVMEENVVLFAVPKKGRTAALSLEQLHQSAWCKLTVAP